MLTKIEAMHIYHVRHHEKPNFYFLFIDEKTLVPLFEANGYINASYVNVRLTEVRIKLSFFYNDRAIVIRRL